eukprot:5993704-Pleurochrysis_carterae.AAC.1
MAPQQDGVQATARLVAEPEYGDAAWASIFSNLKFTGVLPGEGAIPATATAARQQLLASLRARIEDIVGEERAGSVDGGAGAGGGSAYPRPEIPPG